MRKVLLCFTLLPVFAFAQDSAKPVTYTTKAVPLRVVLAEISKQSGLKLRATQTLEEEPLILRLDHVPAKDVMDKIASVFVADWVDHGDYKELDRSDDRIATLRDKIFQARVKAFRESIDALSKLKAQRPVLDETRADGLLADFVQLSAQLEKGRTPDLDKKRFMLSSELPGMRLGVEILSHMDPEELASVEDNSRVVYSSSPTAIQRQLPEIDPEVIHQFINERKALRGAFERNKKDFDKFIDFIGEDSNGVLGEPSKVEAVVQRTGSVMSVQFTLLDTKGAVMSQDYESLGMNWETRYVKRAKRKQLDKEAWKGGYELSTLVRELIARQNRTSNEMRPLTLDQAKQLLSASTYDPLGLATSETILKGAELQGFNAIALVPDSAESWAMRAASSGKTSLERLQAELSYANVTVDIKDGWVVAKPLDPLVAQEERTPRPLMEEFLQRAVSDKQVSIEVAADLRAQVPRNSTLELPALVVDWLLGSNASTPLFSMTPDTLRFYGTLSDRQRDGAKNKQCSIAFSSLSDEQKRMVSDMVFSSFMDPIDTSKEMREQYQQMRERTDILPSGVPMDSMVTVTDDFADVVYTSMTSETGSNYSYGMPIDSIVYQVVQSQHPEVFSPIIGYTPPTVTGWTKGKQRHVTVKVTMNGHLESSDQLTEDHRDPGPPLTFEGFMASLPADVRAKFQKQIDECYQSMLRYQKKDAGDKAQPVTGSQPPTS